MLRLQRVAVVMKLPIYLSFFANFHLMVNLLHAKGGEVLFDGVDAEKKMQDIFYFESVEWLDKNLSGLDYLRFVKNTWKSDVDINQIIEEWDMGGYIKIPQGNIL